jgi:alanine dehydrogenase
MRSVVGISALQGGEDGNQATLPYILKIVRQGINGIIQDPGFSKAVNTYRGWITHPAIAQAWQELNRYQPLEAIA